eukprot:TRINITY_DN3963_c0_g1_i2.p1 TRINITY_DN3963_c0_g1~~TRINITY_DN3963_c0_g1_i2.p1  ORF type:complete len:424 (-),score=126.82 TRINITY_DN3963_c0_g1_i2:141-1412(-)
MEAIRPFLSTLRAPPEDLKHSGIRVFVTKMLYANTKEELEAVAQHYGTTREVHLMTDRVTGNSKGCAIIDFSRREQSEAFIEAAGQNPIMLPGMTKPLEVRWAERNGPDAFKLFFCNFPPNLEEADFRAIFSMVATVEDLHVIRTPTGEPKGCGILRVYHQGEVENVINQMAGKVVLEGLKPLVIKVAEDKKKIQQAAQAATAFDINNVQYHTLSIEQLNQIVVQASHALQMKMAQAKYQSQDPINPAFMPNGVSPGMQAAMAAGTMNAMAQMQIPNMGNMPNMGMGNMGGNLNNMAGMGNMPNMPNTPVNPPLPPSAAPGTTPSAPIHVGGQQKQGPPGANIFIYNLPITFSESEVMASFTPYGEIVSCKVFLDKMTGQSKGFGFVSYSNAMSARAAIDGMNGLQVGNKRLQVELKKDRTPY